MSEETRLFEDTIVLNDLGMHARPAAKIAEMAMEAENDIWLLDGENKADASSIIDILTLCAAKGARIRIQAESFQDAAILNNIKTFFDQGFGELADE